jgi:hypothetical protein
VVYGFVTTGGVYALFFPPTLIRDESASVLTVAWAVFVLLGGLLGLLDVVDGRHLFELPGLLSLVTALAGYASVLLHLGYTSHRGGAITLGWLWLAMVAALGWRALHVVALRRVNR